MDKTPEEIVASIDDLLTEILIRLPIKSVIRFKQVSKHWQSLISDPGFSFRHNPIPNPTVGMFIPSCVNVTIFTRYVSFSNKKPITKLIDQLKDVEIIHSCNGLLLCCGYHNKTGYFVYNPTTNKSSTIPDGGVQSNVLGVCLAFDPARSRHYKIVRVRGTILVTERFVEYNECEYGFEVYSSENGCWRMLDGLFRSRVNFNEGVYWNRAIHWINNVRRECLYFNPDDDDRMVMPRMTPPIPGDREDTFYFGESCGHLNYVEFFQWNVWANVYELKRDYSEWFVKYRVDLSTIYKALNYIKIRDEEFEVETDRWWWFFAFCSTMVVRGERDEESFMVVIYWGKVIMRYNFVEGTCEKICDLRDCDWISFSKGFQYIDSLCVI